MGLPSSGTHGLLASVAGSNFHCNICRSTYLFCYQNFQISKCPELVVLAISMAIVTCHFYVLSSYWFFIQELKGCKFAQICLGIAWGAGAEQGQVLWWSTSRVQRKRPRYLIQSGKSCICVYCLWERTPLHFLLTWCVAGVQ
jgi:hypothetical protein